MAGPRAKRINIPLRRVAVACAVLLFALLANLTCLQAFRARGLNADPRNERALLARYEHPRGDILTYDGRTVATSRATDTGPYRHRRVHTGGETYAPVTGHLFLNRATGIEHAEDAVLAGHDARVRMRALVKDGASEGADVRLTIRDRIQRTAYESLARVGSPGAAVALDPVTGAILALASYPSYDPGAFASQDTAALAAAERRLREDPSRPLLNRALHRTYPPGPSFELVTTAAALASGEYTIASQIDASDPHLPPPAPPAPAQASPPSTEEAAAPLSGPPVSSPGPSVSSPGPSVSSSSPAASLPDAEGRVCGDGRPSLAYAFRLSCGTAFANLGLQLGQDLLRDQAEAFGFGVPDLRIPIPVAASTYPATLDRPGTALSAVGLHADRATPLMIAMLSAAVANGGVLMWPYLVEEVRLPDGSIINRSVPTPYRTVMSPALAGQLAILMATTTQPSAPAAALVLPGVEVAAKTGSGPPAVVTAFAPATAPEVAVAVVLERTPASASQIARAILQAALA
ncbi:penicillin-binding transpeptidase domain-containing protein [Nonomuraea lactucae]|uniref:penicillin-binding transpeptidase domain-containing protein n=1 Tax=Nonomuraea lactucae TaxID=2249762 RepID=UPI000DE2174B|nr:penicillin-binding transpeptidase domain-containing protein [Nonomuraea lactucae]